MCEGNGGWGGAPHATGMTVDQDPALCSLTEWFVCIARSGEAWNCEVSDSLSGVRDASEPRSHLAMLVLLDVTHKRGLRIEEKSRHQKRTHQEHSPTHSIPMHCSIGCPTLTTQSMPHFHIMTARNASQSCKRNPSPEAATQLRSVPIPQATSQPLARQLG